jgi:hypothetical protein
VGSNPTSSRLFLILDSFKVVNVNILILWVSKIKVLKKILSELEYPKMHFFGDFTDMKSKKKKTILGNVIY